MTTQGIVQAQEAHSHDVHHARVPPIDLAPASGTTVHPASSPRSALRDRFDSARRVDAQVNVPARHSNDDQQSKSSKSTDKLTHVTLEREILKNVRNAGLRTELAELLRKGLIGRKTESCNLGPEVNSPTDLESDPATCQLVTRVARVEIRGGVNSTRLLTPSHMILPSGNIEPWNESLGISFIMPVSVQSWDDAQDFVEESLHKWLVEDLHYRLRPTRGRNRTSTLESNQIMEEPSAVDSEGLNEENSDENDIPMPVMPISREVRIPKSTSFRESRMRGPQTTISFSSLATNRTRHPSDATALGVNKIDEIDESRLPEDDETSFESSSLNDANSFSEHKSMHEYSQGNLDGADDVQIYDDVGSVDESDDEDADVAFDSDSEVASISSSSGDEQSVSFEQLSLAVSVDSKEPQIEIKQEDSSRFVPYEELICTYSFTANITEANIEFYAENIRSSVHHVKESPTLAMYRTQTDRCPSRLRLCWEWISKEQIDKRRLKELNKAEGEINSTALGSARSLDSKSSDSSSSFSFLPFLLHELKAQESDTEFRLDVLRKLLAYRCRFRTSQIEEALLRSDIDSSKYTVSIDELRWLASVLEEVMVAWENERESDILCDADLRVIRGLFPNCYSIRLRKLHGGFSGSLVLQATSVDVEGRMQDATVVKLDKVESIQQEESRHRMMLTHLGDHAPFLLGKFICPDSNRGGIKISLAGSNQVAFWSAANTSNPLITLKELYLFEQQEIESHNEPRLKTICLDSVQRQEKAANLLSDMQQNTRKGRNTWTGTSKNVCAMHSVHNALLECFGEIFEKCTVQSSLVEGGKCVGDVRRDLYDLEGVMRKYILDPDHAKTIAENIWDPFTVVSSAQLWHLLGLREAPRVHAKSSDTAGALYDYLLKFSGWLADDDISKDNAIEYYEGMGHGDLNAANIVIDVQSILWVIDFAQSGRAHVLRDICKLTSCILFEYLALESSAEVQAAVLLLDFMTVHTENLSDSLPDDLKKDVFDPVEKSPEGYSDLQRLKGTIWRIQFAWQCCRLLRGYCKKYVRDANDMRQYHAGMVFYAARAICFRDTSLGSKQFALAALLLHSGELMGLRNHKVNRLPSFHPQGEGIAKGPVITDRLRDDVHMRSYLNRLAVKCSHHYDPTSGEVFNIKESLDLEVQPGSTKNVNKKRMQQHLQQETQQEENKSNEKAAEVFHSMSSAGIHENTDGKPPLRSRRSIVRNMRPPPLQLGSTCTNVDINEHSTRFFDSVEHRLGVSLLQMKRIAICGESSSGKTTILKKLVVSALADQNYFVPVYVEALDVCKLLRRRVEVGRVMRNESFHPATGDDYLEYMLRVDSEDSEYSASAANGYPMNRAKSKQVFTFNDSHHMFESANARPVSTIARAAHFFVDQQHDSPNGLGTGHSLRNTPSSKRHSISKRYYRSNTRDSIRVTGLQQRDLLRLHQQELLGGSSQTRPRDESSSPEPKTGSPQNNVNKARVDYKSRRRFRSPKHTNVSVSSIATTHLASPVNLSFGVMELFWADLYGEGSPMFNRLLKTLENGHIILFLDGLDEMRPETRADLLEWIDSHPNIFVILTTRREKDLKSCLQEISFVHVQPMSNDNVTNIVKLHAKQMSRLGPEGEYNILELERFLLNELRRSIFREIIRKTPIFVKMLLFALTNHWISVRETQMQVSGPLLDISSTKTSEEQEVDMDWGVPKIMSYATRHLMKSPFMMQSSQHLAACSKICESDEGQAFLECMALVLHLRRLSRRALGAWCSEALQIYAAGLTSQKKSFNKGIEVANAVITLVRSESLPLIQADNADHGKAWIDRHARFAIHVIQEYLVAAYVFREIQSIEPENIIDFIFELNLTAKDHVHLRSEDVLIPLYAAGYDTDAANCEDGDAGDEQSYSDAYKSSEEIYTDNAGDFSEIYMHNRKDMRSESSLSSTEDDLDDGETLSVVSDVRHASRYRVRKIKLLNDVRWRPVLYFLQKMLPPVDVFGNLSSKLLISFAKLLGPTRFPIQFAKYTRYVARNKDDVLLRQLFTMLQEHQQEMGITLDLVSVPIFARIESDKVSLLSQVAGDGLVSILAIVLDIIKKTSPGIRKTILNNTNAGETALCVAATNGHAECITLLLEHGASINGNDPELCGDAVFLAAYEQKLDCVKILLENGANPNASYDGTSCLFNAAYDGNYKLCELLIQHGASREMPSSSGHLPIDVARQENYTSLYDLLEPRSP